MTRHRLWAPLAALAVPAVALLQFSLPVLGAPAAAAATSDGHITLKVSSARSVNGGPSKGDAVKDYHWLVTAEDVGNPHDAVNTCVPKDNNGHPSSSYQPGTGHSYNPADGSCQWPSVRYTPGNVPVVAEGDQSDLNATSSLDLPAGRYLISTTASDYKIDGAHFTVAAGGNAEVDVDMQPYPLPTGTLRARVFKDVAPVDGTYEVGAEPVLAGFTAHLNDVFGEVTTDFYGNRLCTNYKRLPADATHPDGQVQLDGNGLPVINTANPGGSCKSDANGDVVIPNLGPDRYTLTVVAPTGQKWYQTTTLEGNHDWDMWIAEGDSGFDNEMTVAGEKVPPVDMGYVPANPTQGLPDSAPKPMTGSASIVGTGVEINAYVGGSGGVPVAAGVAGGNIRGPINAPIIALSDLGANDQMVWIGRGDANGKFTIPNVPTGDYQLTEWDYNQDMILDSFNVTVNKSDTVAGAKPVDVGQKGLTDWYTEVRGSVFVDANGNGKRDPGESGIPQFPIVLKQRDNSTMDAGQNTATTDKDGHYDLREGYPISRWSVLEAFNTRYKTTGVTVKADNEPTPTTYLGSAVDISLLPVIGLSGTVDWGVQPYANGENGGIVGTVTYDTTRNELDPADAVTEGYQPGIPGLTVHLYAPVACTATSTAPDYAGADATCTDGYWHYSAGDAAHPGAIVPASDAGGPINLADPYTTETWEQPTGCTARQHDGSVLTDQYALPDPTDKNALCVEAPMSGWQVAPSDKTTGAFGQTVNGNYGFTDSTVNLNPSSPDYLKPLGTDSNGDPITAPLPGDDFIVTVDIPKTANGKPMYQVTKEEDVNVFDGDRRLPQENFPVSDTGAGDTSATPGQGGPISQTAGIVSACVGDLHTVHVTDQGFLDNGGSPYEGESRPLCDQKLVSVRANQAVAPNFNLFTTVPLPTHFWGLTINDLGLSNDKTQVGYGEAQPLPGVPMGIYDWAGKLVDTVQTDYNGMYEALEPSTSSYNCPLPAGPCPGMYYFKGNDPGQPGHVNKTYNPRFRTIGTNFQAWPGLFTVTDTAPTQVASIVLQPDGTPVGQVVCDIANDTPQLFAVDKPYTRNSVTTTKSGRKVTTTYNPVDLTIRGVGFGTAPTVTLTGNGSVYSQAVKTGTTATDGQVQVTLQTGNTGALANALTPGVYTLNVTNAGGKSLVNGLTFHVLGTNIARHSYDPKLIQVNPPASAAGDSSNGPGNAKLNFPSAAFPAITAGDPNTTPENVLQRAVSQAASYPQALVVVWPNGQVKDNPTGDYFENLVVSSPVKLQGVGPGGFSTGDVFVPGSRIDGIGFNPDNNAGAAWVTTVAGITHGGPADVPDAAVVTVLPATNHKFTPGYAAAINGFTITGGSQADTVTNVNTNGSQTTPVGGSGQLITQGGGVYVHSDGDYLQISDDIISANSGSYGGGIRVGSPYLDASNNNVAISRNQIRDNGGTNLAGGIGIFRGSTGYSIDHNNICGNFSAEYGGGITQYGLAGGKSIGAASRIVANKIWFNQSYDEGGGVMVAGELPLSLNQLSTGSGTVVIDQNLIEENMANDDGGGLRFLQAGNAEIDVTNNMVVNNISAHEGGGLALDDSTNVHVTGNTVMKNVTTATAITSNGQPAPAGLSTGTTSDLLQATLGSKAPTYSKPQDFKNNIFWDNRAGTWDPTSQTVTGIGASGAKIWNVGSGDDLARRSGTGTVPDTIAVANTVLNPLTGAETSQLVAPLTGTVNKGVNRTGDPQVLSPFDLTIQVQTSRLFPSFRQSAIVADIVTPGIRGDYHLPVDVGSAVGLADNRTNQYVSTSVAGLMAHDIDGDNRPKVTNRQPDAGADEVS